MNPIDPRILKFVSRHHVLTLATCHKNEPYTASCFYTWSDDLQMFIFTSDPETRHASYLKVQKRAAGTIALETKIIGKIRGIQFTGDVFELENNELEIGRKAYLKRFPYAIVMKTHFWGFSPDFIKMTDNRLGFGKKIIWEKTDF